MDGDKFIEIMANAQKLMLDEGFNQRVESKAASFAGRANVSGGISNAELANYEQMAFGHTQLTESKPIQMIQAPQSKSMDDKRYAKLPQAIRESFTKQPPMSGDGIDNTPLGRATDRLTVNEQAYRQPVQQQMRQTVTGGVDYSLIKSIIDESIRRNMEEIKKSMLNESTVRGVRITKGNKIQLLDTVGNLYEGVLALKKKAAK
jgi:hypothetical protein